MKPYAALNRAGQTRRMRRLVETALAAYPLPPARLTRLAQGWNTTFRVDTADGNRFVLRVHRPDGPTTPMVRSELTWLAALRRETDLGVPEPVSTRDGDLLTVASAPGVPEPRTCDLLRWIDGRFVDRGLTPVHLRRVGEFMGHLQAHAARLDLPDGFTRGRVDHVTRFGRTRADNLSAEVAAHAADLVGEVHSTRGGPIVREVIDRARQARDALGPEAAGLIHADLHQENYLFDGERVHAIDFDDCGHGPYVYDLAVTLSELAHRPDYPALRVALLDGYRAVRPLPAAHERHIDTFIVFRTLQLMLVAVEERDTPMFRDSWSASVARDLDRLERSIMD